MKKYLSSYAHLVKEWHPTMNGDLTPKDVSYASNKKVWWLCSKGHSYETKPSERTRKKPTGCRYCAGKQASSENNLEKLFPEIAKEWHPTMNGDLTPRDVTPGSDKKRWWLCPKGHPYDAIIGNRTRKKSGCPYCAGKQASSENNLEKLFPEIAKEWHPTMNGDLTPKDVTHGSHKKVWWLCPKGHTYNSIVKSRTSGSYTGCRKCSNQSSEPEIRILTELKWFFEKVNNRQKIGDTEVDIFIPSINVAIEYDGNYWHRNKETRDLEKNKFLLSHNIHLIRVRQIPLKPLSENDILVGESHSLDKNDLDDLLRKIVRFANSETVKKIETYINESSFVNDDLFNQYRSYFPSPFPEKSLLNTHSEISKEWDYDKNYPLRPENFSHGSHYDAWWLCPQGYSYNSRIDHRLRTKIKCPHCLGRKSLNYDLFK